jgi:biopolymer transport protein ExbD/biopolymer transport protein TolR
MADLSNILFMVTAAALSQAVAGKAAQPSAAPQFISIALSPTGELYFGEEQLAPEAFALRLAAAAKGHPELEVQLRADRSVPYGRVAELIGMLQKEGLNRIAFVAEPEPASR